MERIDAAHVPAELSPTTLLKRRVFGFRFREVIRHGAFPCQAPDDRIGSPTGYEIPPVLLQFRHAHPGQEIAPTADDARRQAMLDQILNSQIGRVEVPGIDAGVVRLPGEPGFVRAARVKRRHVGIESCDNLDYREALVHAVGHQRLKVFRPAQAATQSHPPGVRQPEKRLTVLVLEVQAIARYAHRAVFTERVIPCVG